MNKLLVTGITAAGILLGGASIAGAAVNNNSETTVKETAVQSEEVVQTKDATAAESLLSMEKAQEIALSEQDGHIDSIELESDEGYVYYEVETENGDTEYDIYIEASTGEVLKVDRDDHDDDDYEVSGALENSISAEKAMQIAVEKVGGKVIEMELDEDDNRYEYEIEIKTNDGEVEMTIDAVTGKILEIEKDD